MFSIYTTLKIHLKIAAHILYHYTGEGQSRQTMLLSMLKTVNKTQLDLLSSSTHSGPKEGREGTSSFKMGVFHKTRYLQISG